MNGRKAGRPIIHAIRDGEIVAARLTGLAISEIASTYGVSNERVRKILQAKAPGSEHRLKHLRPTNEQIVALNALLAEGVSATKISRMLKISRDAIYRWGPQKAPGKRCTRCGVILPRDRFYKNGPYLHGACKDCHNAL